LQLPGTLIEGKYEILGKIREGGMGTIYRVRHRLLDEIRAVKVLKPQALSSEEMKRRFIEEARTATRLKHPNIGTIHDFALDEEGKAYLVMEFIDGVNLADLLKRQGPPGIALSLEVAHQALLALGYLHRKNVVHRDIAPDNLMLTHDEDRKPVVKLIDLGIAKALDRPGEMTSTGVFLGKLKYASPEQFGSLPAGEKLDGRSDLYALGVVLYELLTGVYPFVGESPSELLRAHLFDPPLAFSRTDPDGKVPPEVRDALGKALQKRREDRFGSAEEFDREIVLFQQHFSHPDDLDDTAQIISKLRGIAPSASEPTPSVQDRLDRQFLAASTPRPSRDTLLRSVGEEKTVGEARRSPPGTTQIDTQPLKRPPKRSRLLAGAAAAIVLLAAVALLRSVVLPRSSAPKAPVFAPPQAPPPTKATSETALPLAVPAAQPTIAAEAPTVPPQPTAMMQEPPRAAAAEQSPRGERREAEQARSRAAAARRLAERARAPERVGALYDFGASKEQEGRHLFARGEFSAAAAAFDAGRDSFVRAEEWTRAHPVERPIVSGRVAALSTPTIHPQSSAAAALPPTAVPAPVRVVTAAPAPAEPARGERVTEEDRIRETIRRYEKAQSALDADLYSRVYPSIDKVRVRAAFEQLRSQTLEFEIQKIELTPGATTAVVRGLEKRAALPRVGSEQHAVSNRVITLEKRGDAWVIVRLGS
jgi:serine/threonine-protein kinase